MVNMKRNLKDHVVVENGIPTIRRLHPVTKKPMGTEQEIATAFEAYVAAKAAWTPKKQDESQR